MLSRPFLSAGQYPSYAFGTPGFESLQHEWGRLGTQEDAHEFSTVLLMWCSPSCVDVTWSRRVSMEDQVTNYDVGSKGMPPSLLFGEGEKGACSLQQLVDTWHHHSGMRTCFNHAPEMLGFHLDRATRNDSGAVWDVELDPSVLVPIWTEESSLLTHHREYVPVSVLFHTGDEIESGHLQAAMLTCTGWYISDDGRVALPDESQLTEVLDKIIFVWLIRDDVFALAVLPSQLNAKDDWIRKAAWYLQTENYRALKQDDMLMKVLAHHCADCGISFFSATGLDHHIRSMHPRFHVVLRAEYMKLELALDASWVPCHLCKTTWHPRKCTGFELDIRHVCPTVMNLAMAYMHYWSTLCPLGSRYALPSDDEMPPSGPLPPQQSTRAADPIGAFLGALLQ